MPETSSTPLEITPSRLPDDLAAVQHLINQSQPQAAHAALASVLQQRPNDALVRVFAALVARMGKQFAQGRTEVELALQLNPQFFPAWIELARLEHATGRLDEAALAFKQAHELLPDAVDGLLEWYGVLYDARRYAESLPVIALLAERRPDDVSVRLYLASTLQQLGRHAEASALYEPLLAQAAQFPLMLNNYAAALMNTGRQSEALPIFQQEVAARPDNTLARVNLATLLKERFDIDAAQEQLRTAAAQAPRYPIVHNNLGLLLKEYQQWDEAEACFRRALALDENYFGARWNLAMHRLLRGDFAEGWPLHEARWVGAPELRHQPNELPKPRWRGEPLEGKTLLVWSEQGAGDILQFVRYLPRLAEQVHAQGGRLLLSANKTLQPLLNASFKAVLDAPVIDDTVPLPLADFDCHCPLLSLPLHLGIGAGDLAVPVPYLKPATARVTHWKKQLAEDQQLRVGLAWSGSLTHQRNPLRAVGIDAYTRFADVPGVSFYNLQFGAAADVAKAREAGLPLIDLTPEMADFNDSAAFMSQLDLVISVCTSTAHLAGALGKPCWVPLDVNPHWVWMLESEDSPWYPHTRLFRQPAYRQWEPVLERLHAALREWAANGGQAAKPAKAPKPAKPRKG
ncbi:Flp pilus assembly protein TadD, contains TPR repeats [Polaromonas sp. YR568]|uniref:tetratricopeptide repeat protein n=1 Tax=Polaromonas sp. YR568 TaxID=1855301 RepID=UPI0008F11D76|nr:tetratricopeptide repeat protein [Polaromonas sp. YR568]SFU37378.1 Flp pilus assembly protein TadD, contains TPR repeats [Polaromonas sp. YR568]